MEGKNYQNLLNLKKNLLNFIKHICTLLNDSGIVRVFLHLDFHFFSLACLPKFLKRGSIMSHHQLY